MRSIKHAILKHVFPYFFGVWFRRTIFGSLALFGIFGCSTDTVYEENVDVKNHVWMADSAMVFEFKIEQATDKYDIFYNFRNTIAYPFYNLYVTYELKDRDEKVLLNDLYNMNLFDPKTGKPYGKGLGDIFSHQFKVIPQYEFPDTGTYTLHLKQYMRRDSLPEILSVGVSIKPGEAADRQGD